VAKHGGQSATKEGEKGKNILPSSRRTGEIVSDSVGQGKSRVPKIQGGERHETYRCFDYGGFFPVTGDDPREKSWKVWKV